jgi:uncharacterized protein (TIGR04141 family)
MINALRSGEGAWLMPRQKTRRLKILLLREDVESFENALRNPEGLTAFDTQPDLGFTGRFFLQEVNKSHPGWQEFLNEGLVPSIPAVSNQTNAGVLLLRTAHRFFAVTFGYGRNLLKSDVFVRDFGLKVVLNTVDADKLRSVDVKSIEELVVTTRRQTSRTADLDTFGLDASHDLLKAVTGTPREQVFGRRISGADTLAVAIPCELSDLADRCELFLNAYERTDYRERFEFIDHMAPVRDRDTVEMLNDQLVSDLTARRLDRLYLAAPDPMEWTGVSGFTYSDAKTAPVFEDLDIEDWLATLDPERVLDVAELKGRHVGVRFDESETSSTRWSLFSCLVYESQMGDNLYVLSDGDWFQVAKTFADRVQQEVTGLREDLFHLPPAGKNEAEAAYNARVAAELGFGLMDQVLVLPSGARTRIEFCDLLTADGRFIHVKRKTRSATLSHLFAQGVVSAQEFILDASLRAEARGRVPTDHPELAALLTDAPPQPRDYRVVYAVVSGPTATWPLSLPFFSQLNASTAATLLRKMGLKVSLVQIEELPA